MAGSDGAILLTTARWSGSSSGGQSSGSCGQQTDESPHVYLHDVVKSGELPQLVRIVKGSYLGLGAPSLPNPSLSSTALVASAGASLRLAVQCLKFKDNHKTVNVGPKLAIPETFDGYFEILNEDGRAVRGIESVAELARKFPDSCLVRQNLKVFYQQSTEANTHKSTDGQHVNITERSRTLTAGELLVLVGEVTGSGGSLSSSPSSSISSGQRFLHCLDSRGDHVYLPLDMRAKFSVVAKEDNQQGISGVHRIRALLNKRLPLTVRMVSGSPPAGLKIGQQFCYEMRLLASFREEMIVAMPLGVNQGKTSPDGPGVVIIPPSVSLKLQLPVNRQSLKASKEFARMTERCLHQYGLLSDRIQVYDAHFSKNLRFDGQHWRVPVPLLLAPLRRSTSDLIQSITGHGGSGSHKNKNSGLLDNSMSGGGLHHSLTAELPEGEEGLDADEEELPAEYDEIDQIYDYIRGFAPLPKNLKTTTSTSTYDIFNESNRLASGRKAEQRRNLYNKVVSHKNGSNNNPSHHNNLQQQQQPTKAINQQVKPVPPPLETIPTHRNRINSYSKEVASCPAVGEKETDNNLNSPSAAAATTVTITVNSSPEPVAKPRMYRQRSALASGGVAPSVSAGQRLYSKNPAVVIQHRSPGMLSPAESKQSLTPSPLFNIRYKSMTNLLLANSAADSDTLGSSQSGGRCSGGSAGSAAVRSPHHHHHHIPAGSQQRLHHSQQHHQQHHYMRQVSAPPVSQHRLFQLHRPRSLTDLLWGRASSSDQRNNNNNNRLHGGGNNVKSPLKINLHPTVVADVIPSSSSRTSGLKREIPGRRRHSGSNHHLLNTATGNGSSSSHTTTKKHTIFYHL